MVKERLEAGEDPLRMLEDMGKGMDIVGEKYSEGDYFLPEVVVASDVFQECMVHIKPKLLGGERPKIGKIVIGTAYGDIHGMGKDLVAVFAEGAGFEVHNIGVDVPPSKFVEEASWADIVAISGLMTTSASSMNETTKALTESGRRDKVKVIIGGPMVNKMWGDQSKVDFYTRNGMEGVKKMTEWMDAKIVEHRGG
jgi:5-methyltetrahydrofolate--homocysteine methyltransferase